MEKYEILITIIAISIVAIYSIIKLYKFDKKMWTEAYEWDARYERKLAKAKSKKERKQIKVGMWNNIIQDGRNVIGKYRC